MCDRNSRLYSPSKVQVQATWKQLTNYWKIRVDTWNLCPGAVLAIRMPVLGCHLVGIEDPRGADLKKLIVWAEIDRWLVDALEVVTGVRLGKRTLKYLLPILDRTIGTMNGAFWSDEESRRVGI